MGNKMVFTIWVVTNECFYSVTLIGSLVGDFKKDIRDSGRKKITAFACLLASKMQESFFKYEKIGERKK